MVVMVRLVASKMCVLNAGSGTRLMNLFYKQDV
jgi:hypothetical protein